MGHYGNAPSPDGAKTRFYFLPSCLLRFAMKSFMDSFPVMVVELVADPPTGAMGAGAAEGRFVGAG